jgi:hypothetical protein
MNLPAPNYTPDLTEVIKRAEDWMIARLKGEFSSDHEVLIFGPLMQAIYGPDIYSRLDAISLSGKSK